MHAYVVAAMLGSACGRFGFDPLPAPDGPQLEFDALVASCALTPTPVHGTEYFVVPNGDDALDGRTPATAWGTFARAWSTIVAGDTLTLLDGTYLERLFPQVFGEPGAPILIRAQHDGAAIIDGENLRAPCTIQDVSNNRAHDFELEGVTCVRPNDTAQGGEMALIVYHADRVKVRRVTARGEGDGVIAIYDGDDDLLEDVAAYGGGLQQVAIAYSHRATVRRAYVRYTAIGVTTTEADLFTILDSTDSVVENTVLTATPQPMGMYGFVVATGLIPSDRTLLAGNVVHGPLDDAVITSWVDTGGNLQMAGTTVRDTVTLVPGAGVFQRNDATMVIDRLTAFGVDIAFEASTNAGSVPPLELGITLRDSVLATATYGISINPDPLITSVVHSDTVFDAVVTPYVGTTAGPNEQQFHPAWDAATYGNGGFLIRPANLAHAGGSGRPAGAEILYRTVDGVLTSTPLWPWPMEARIAAEEGASVTWESGGGIWRAPPPVACP